MLSLVLLCSGVIHAQGSDSKEVMARKVEVARAHDSSTETIFRPEQNNSEKLLGIVQPNSSAPSLTQVFVANVCSDKVGCETISRGQFSTSLVHGGSNIDIYVWEIGYGNGEIATQGGASVDNQYKIDYRGVCSASGGGYTVNCPSGTTYIGWRYVWNVAYYLNLNYGYRFAAQDTSSVSEGVPGIVEG